jgi:hypothetical protein
MDAGENATANPVLFRLGFASATAECRGIINKVVVKDQAFFADMWGRYAE